MQDTGMAISSTHARTGMTKSKNAWAVMMGPMAWTSHCKSFKSEVMSTLYAKSAKGKPGLEPLVVSKLSGDWGQTNHVEQWASWATRAKEGETWSTKWREWHWASFKSVSTQRPSQRKVSARAAGKPSPVPKACCRKRQWNALLTSTKTTAVETHLEAAKLTKDRNIKEAKAGCCPLKPPNWVGSRLPFAQGSSQERTKAW